MGIREDIASTVGTERLLFNIPIQLVATFGLGWFADEYFGPHDHTADAAALGAIAGFILSFFATAYFDHLAIRKELKRFGAENPLP